MIAPAADRETWQRVKARLRVRVGDDAWTTWMTSLMLENVSPTVARLTVLSPLVRDWIESHHHADLVACWQAELPGIVNVTVALRANKLRLIGDDVRRERATETALLPPPVEQELPPPAAKPSLDSFLLCCLAANKLAGAIEKATSFVEEQMRSRAEALPPGEPVLDDIVVVPKIPHIQRVVAEFYGITRIDICSHRRTREVVWPRQIAMFLAKSMTTWSLVFIGRHFGSRDHTTVLHAVRKVEARLPVDPGLLATIEKLATEIRTVGEKNERIRLALLNQSDRDHPHAEGPHGT